MLELQPDGHGVSGRHGAASGDAGPSADEGYVIDAANSHACRTECSCAENAGSCTGRRHRAGLLQ